MADISKLTRLVSGIQRQVDLSTNTLVVGNIKNYIGGANYFTWLGTLTAIRNITMPDADVDLGNLTNSNISASAAIALSKLAALTANRALASNGSGVIVAATTTDTELGYVSGVTSAIQTQINSKVARAGDTMSGNLAMGANKVTGLGAATVNGDAVRFEQAVFTDGSHAITGNQSFSGTAKITNLLDPTLAQDGATKAYVDNAVTGLSWKHAARAASTANVTVASAPATLDGITLTSGDRILLKDQTAGAENGIYNFNGTAVALTRATDSDTWIEIVGSVVYIISGTVNVGSKFNSTNVTGGTLGTTAITYTVFSAASALSGSGTAGYNAYWTAAQTLAAEQFVSAARGGLATDASAFTGLLKFSAGTASASSLVNADVAAGAAIAYSKLALTNSVVNADVAAGAAIAYSKLALTNSIVNADIAAAAAIAYSKLVLTNSIVNADVAAGAAIAYSKLVLTNSITLADHAANSVDENKIVSTTMSTTGAITGGSGAKLAVAVDASSIEISTNALRVKTTAYDQSTITGGSGVAAAVAYAPKTQTAETANEAFAATTLWAVRWAKAADVGFVAGRVSKADNNAATVDNFYVAGLSYSAGSVSAGGTINVVKFGIINVPTHGFTVGSPLFLDASGAITATAPSTINLAVVRVGIVKDANNIDVSIQIMGIN